jgi:hypothetical protein
MHGYTAKCAKLGTSLMVFRAFLFTDAEARRKSNSVLWTVIPQRTVDNACREELPIDP